MLQTKHLPLELVELKADDGLMQFTGYSAHFSNTDHGGDVILPGAFDETLARRSSRPLLWQHDLHSPIGRELSLKVDDRGLIGTWQLARTALGLDAYELLKLGAVGAMSIGYVTEEADYDGDVRLLKRVDLLENSVVTLPMNEQAVITTVKADQPADQRIRNLTDILRAVRVDTAALKARREAEGRKPADRVLEALAESETEAKAWLDLLAETLHEAKAEAGAPSEATTESAATAASESAPSAPDLRLRIERARCRLRLSGTLERAS